MNKAQAQSLIRSTAQTGCIFLSTHCKERMRERNVNTDDILHVMMWGQVKEIKNARKNNEWEIRVAGKDLNGSNLVVVAAVNKNRNTLIITVWG